MPDTDGPDLRGHRPARRHQDRPRGAVPGAHRRRADPRPQPDQLLRRDRAGRVPPRSPRPGHRLRRRPAAARPAVLVPRHPADPPRRSELRPDPDQPAGRAGQRQQPRRLHAAGGARGRRAVHAELARRRLPVRRARRDGAYIHPPQRGRRAEGEAAAGELRRPLHPGHALLPVADRRRAGAHRRRVQLRAGQVRQPRHPRPHGRQPRPGRRRPRRAGRRPPRHRRARRLAASSPASLSPALSMDRDAPGAGRRAAMVAVLVDDDHARRGSSRRGGRPPTRSASRSSSSGRTSASSTAAWPSTGRSTSPTPSSTTASCCAPSPTRPWRCSCRRPTGTTRRSALVGRRRRRRRSASTPTPPVSPTPGGVLRRPRPAPPLGPVTGRRARSGRGGGTGS